MTSHIAVLAVWLLAAGVLIGIGSLLRQWWGLPVRSWRELSLSFWLGIGGAILVLQLWHLLLPVDVWAVVALVALGAAGLWRGRRDLREGIGSFDGRLTLLAVLLLAWLANRALGPTALFDTGMYHQPTVAWSNAFALVPGLGNLHGRLAFNSASLLLAAAFDVGPFDGAALHLVNGLLAAALLTEGVLAWHSARRGTHPRAHDLFSLAIMPNVVHGLLRQDVRSLSTDAAVCAVLFATTRLLFDLLAHPSGEREARARRVVPIVFLFTTAVTIKLSAAVFAATGALVALWTLGAGRPSQGLRLARLARWLTPAVLLFIVWVARGVVLSGYPIYPSGARPFPVDWRVPSEQVAAEAGWITMSARNLNSNVIYPGASWIVPWLRGIVIRGDPFAQLTVPALLMGVVAAFALVTRRRRTSPLWGAHWTLVAIPLGTGVVFWLASAPHTRMAQGILWSAAGVALGWWASVRTSITGGTRQTADGRPDVPFRRPSAPPSRRSPAERLAFVVIGLTSLLVVKQALGAALRAPDAKLLAAVDALVTRPHQGQRMAPLPVPQLTPVTLGNDLRVDVPVSDNSCWNSVRCTPHPSSSLRLRRPDLPAAEALRHGFRSANGEWAPQRWPNPWTPFLAWWRCVRAAPDSGAGVERRCLSSVN
ncbi:MAG: LIC_10190 family membrane protein [Gemmatimonadaceae bacterium]